MEMVLTGNTLFRVLKADDSGTINDIDVSLYIPRDVDETGITVASRERFSACTADKDGKALARSGTRSLDAVQRG